MPTYPQPQQQQQQQQQSQSQPKQPFTTSNFDVTSCSSFEVLRQDLLSEISLSFDHVLANINKLNRSLEGVIVVGHEFSSVEALWSTFENVMAKDATDPPQASNPSAAPEDQFPASAYEKTTKVNSKHR